jgi:integrase
MMRLPDRSHCVDAGHDLEEPRLATNDNTIKNDHSQPCLILCGREVVHLAETSAVKAARRNGEIDMDMISKNGKELSIFEARRLTAILNEKDDIQMGRAAKHTARKVGNTLVLNRLGQPYTEDGLDSSFDRIKRELVKSGKIRPGPTFHGLRKSLRKDAADLGFSENDIAGALGQANPASARPYTIEVGRRRGALRVFRALNKACQ